MDNFGSFVSVPRTADAGARGAAEEIESILRDELGQHADSLIKDCCENGGWPGDIEVEVTNIEIRETEIVAEVEVNFNEIIPSACRDVSFSEKRHRWLTLRLQRGSTDAEIEPSASDSQRWDVADRNSASDGE